MQEENDALTQLRDILSNPFPRNKKEAQGQETAALSLIEKLVPEDLVAQDLNGQTLLQWACLWNHTKSALALIQRMSSEQLALKNKFNQTALYFACKKNRQAIMNALREKMLPNHLALEDDDVQTALACTEGDTATTSTVRKEISSAPLASQNQERDAQRPALPPSPFADPPPNLPPSPFADTPWCPPAGSEIASTAELAPWRLPSIHHFASSSAASSSTAALPTTLAPPSGTNKGEFPIISKTHLELLLQKYLNLCPNLQGLKLLQDPAVITALMNFPSNSPSEIPALCRFSEAALSEVLCNKITYLPLEKQRWMVIFQHNDIPYFTIINLKETSFTIFQGKNHSEFQQLSTQIFWQSEFDTRMETIENLKKTGEEVKEYTVLLDTCDDYQGLMILYFLAQCSGEIISHPEDYFICDPQTVARELGFEEVATVSGHPAATFTHPSNALALNEIRSPAIFRS